MKTALTFEWRIVSTTSNYASLSISIDSLLKRPIMLRNWVIFLRELMKRRRRHEREQKKSNTFRLAKQKLRTRITLFCICLCCQCTTTGWKCIITRFGEDVNTRRRHSFSFPELWYSLLELICRKKCQHLTNWTTWNKRDKVWSRATSLFKWGLRNCRLRCCLKSIKSNPDGDGDGHGSETVT